MSKLAVMPEVAGGKMLPVYPGEGANVSGKAAELEARGRQALEKEDFALAESLFLQALAEEDDPSIRNNLALVRYMAGKPAEALEVLEAGINANTPNPYGRALAAHCLAALGRMREAKRMVAGAVKNFDTFLRIMKAEGRAVPESWLEYAVIIMRSAGLVKDHGQVWDLYQRWQKLHLPAECRYLAGIAAFNLRRFRQAASCWIGLEQVLFSSQLQLVSIMADKGLIPPFSLEYDWFQKVGRDCYRQARTEAELQAAVAEKGLFRLFLLVVVFSESMEQELKKIALEAIVCHGGDWGREVGLSFLQSSLPDDKVKLMAAEALVKAGVFAEGEDIPILIDGRLQVMRIMQTQVTWDPPEEISAAYDQALSLRDQGKVREALLLLEEQSRGQIIYPPAMLLLANLYRMEKMYDKALPLLEMLESIAPDHPIFLFNLAAFWLARKNEEKAKGYLERIDPKLGNEEFRAKYRLLKLEIETMSFRVIDYEDSLREDIEERKLTVDPSMVRGLRNMPAEWVRAACAFWKVDYKTRKEGEAALVAAVTSPAAVRRAVLQLTPEERELLVYLLQRGGWARMYTVVRRFGSMDGDGLLVDEPPRSAAGKLWLKGLIFVGRAVVKNRKEKIATIAVELREMLSEVLSV